ncbi:MAG: TolC family protein [Spirochaetales bacterium]|jgi:outer membrane protein TolC|nr:TolC family protein [Spirochaetales bacterium]
MKFNLIRPARPGLFLFLGLRLAASLCLAAQEGQTLSLEEAVTLALENNLSLVRNSLELETLKRTAGTAWNSLLPSLSASLSLGRGTSLTGDLTEARREWGLDLGFQAGLTLPFSLASAVQKAGADYRAGLSSYQQARLNLEVLVRKAYYQILLLEANLELSRQNLASSQARLEEISARRRLGQASALEELSARVDLENLRLSLGQAETRRLNALEDLALTLGFPPGSPLELEGSLEDRAGEFFNALPEALAFRLSNPAPENPSLPSGEAAFPGLGLQEESWTLQALRESLAALEAERTQRQLNAYLPSLRLSWSASGAVESKGWQDNAGRFGLSLSYDLAALIPGSGVQNALSAIDTSLEAARLRLLEEERLRESRTIRNQRTILESLETIQALNYNAELARQSYQMSEASYRQGLISLDSLRTAGDNLLQTRNQLLQADYNFIAAVLDLEAELNIPFGTLWN